jgi:uncharacterized protein YgbK (DUF1537 family)
VTAPAHDKPIFSFYGDDFTGSTDALDALAGSGLKTVLFLQPPSSANLAAFSDCRAVGIAGDSRSQSPDWMRLRLPAIFESLRSVGAPIVQYKICSTFDSSPGTGSIGCALEIGQDVFDVDYVPIVAAAPLLRRYVLFGNLFAAEGDAVYRIDRHPAMRQHPITPMGESDLRLHLALQTSRKLAHVDMLTLSARDAHARFANLLREQPDGILFDGMDRASLIRAAGLIWRDRNKPQAFVVGSSGFTTAMVEYWRGHGWVPDSAAPARAKAADRLLVLAGSCSPATHRQVCHALRNGFSGVPIDPAQMCDASANGSYRSSLSADAVQRLAAGRSVVMYSALGPSSIREIGNRQALAGEMGKLLRQAMLASGVRRVVVAGGDTASFAVGELGIDALTFLAPLAPGAPLCKAHSAAPEWRRLELVLKGGQVGPESFFEDVLRPERRIQQS